MLDFTDQIGNNIQLNSYPKSIVSLVPSITELLYYLNLKDEISGISKYCILPDEGKDNATIVGGTKNVSIQKVTDCNADLIIANKEENTKAIVSELSAICPVLVTDVNSYNDALDMIRLLSEVCNRASEGERLISEIQSGFEKQIHNSIKKAAYFIWYKPYMVAASNTFINDMLKKAGFVNVFESYKRYPEISLDKLKEIELDKIMLSSEPYPFSQRHLEEFRLEFPGIEVEIVDGQMFSWYGSRLKYAAAYFSKL